jgi:hypothetical protein
MLAIVSPGDRCVTPRGAEATAKIPRRSSPGPFESAVKTDTRYFVNGRAYILKSSRYNKAFTSTAQKVRIEART